MELRACALPSRETPITFAPIARSASTTRMRRARRLIYLQCESSSRCPRIPSELPYAVRKEHELFGSIRHKTVRLHAQPIERGRRGDVKTGVLLISPSQIRRLFRQDDSAQVAPVRVPNPDSLRAGDIDIPRLVHFHSIRHAVAFSARLLRKNPPVCQRVFGGEIKDPNVPRLAVIDIETLAIRRECQAIRLRQLLRQQTHLS